MAADSNRSSTRPVAIDLFAGAGGLSLGFEMAGFDVVSAVEYDPVHAATHLFNFPDCDVLCRDVSMISGSDLRASAAAGWRRHNPEVEWDGVVDVIVGGPSCQGFSVMGKRDENDERNKLVEEFARLVVEVRPRAFVMENVPGILSPQYAAMLAGVLGRLRDAGYTLNDHAEPLDATAYGVPQRRKRVVIVGTLRGVEVLRPAATVTEAVTAGEALAGLPRIVGRSGADGELLELSDDQYDSYVAADNPYLRALAGGHLAHARPTAERVLSGCLATEHQSASIARFRDVAQGTTEPVSRAWRIARSAPVRTLRAGTGRERGAFSASRPLHPDEPRVITVREAARLHSFPDWFRFHATNWHAHRQIGNAVPPFLARAVATSVLAALDREVPSHVRPVGAGDPSLLALSPTSAATLFEAFRHEVPRPRRRPQPKTGFENEQGAQRTTA
ncbi:hypothetical protein NS263_04060 [Curtobacterium oceanosedimentum]|uniref:DNA (cytosine-5-)-methyltransferase n=1 Tax=Curtobacterium oceanosedimentum TaxID=465820 RepID=A0ABR5S8L3_9MICO|nr:DNA cytosine methyltransferase [Curtobacterium oceanosedimentum]KTR41659.1 hypothetical protein NS263_04060 [Curtobacterium oceanosedimentum]